MDKVKAKFEIPAVEIGKILAAHLARSLGNIGRNFDVDYSLQWEIIDFKNGDKTEHMLKGATVEFIEKIEQKPVAAVVQMQKPKGTEDEQASANAPSGA